MRRWLLPLALIAAPAAAPATGQGEPPAEAAELADRFEYALVAGDYRMLDVTDDFTYLENGARLDPWDGMWRTTTAIEGVSPAQFSGAWTLDYRVELDTVDTTVRVVEVEENGVRGVMAYRLLARDGAVARIDVLPVREEFSGERGGTHTLMQPVLPFTMMAGHVGPPDPAFARDTVADENAMVSSVPSYFAGPSRTGSGFLGFRTTADCTRYDNGQRATGVADAPLLDPAQPDFRPYALGCADQVASGLYANFVPGRIDFFTDPARGIAIAFVRLDQPGTVLSFDAPGYGTISYPGPHGAVPDAASGEQFAGRILANMITPMSVNGVYIFKFEGDAIARIDAFYRGAPYGWTAMDLSQ